MSHPDDKLRVNLPPDPNPKPLRFRLPPGSWDTHFHLYGPPHRFPYVEDRRYTPPAAPLEHYLALINHLGIDRGVVVHPMVHGFENWVTLDALKRTDGRLRGMIRADATLTPARMKELHAGGVRGLRMALRKRDGHVFSPDLFNAMARLMAPLNWALDLQIDGDAILELSPLIRAAPVPVIIDTFGYIDFRKGGAGQPAAREMIALLRTGRVFVKLHGANRFMDMGVAFAEVVGLARAYIEAAPDQVIWGTEIGRAHV